MKLTKAVDLCKKKLKLPIGMLIAKYNIMKNLSLLVGALFTLTSSMLLSCSNSTKPVDRQEALPSSDTASSLKASNAAEPDGIPIDIESIRQAYTATVEQMKQGMLDSISFNYSCNEEKRGSVSYFTKGGALRMIVHRYGEYDHHHAVDQYFIKDSAIFFIYTNTVLWSFDDGANGATKDNVTELRSYIVDGKPIKCLEKKFIIKSTSSTNPDPETVANKDIKCGTFNSVAKDYQVLQKYRNNPTSGCLEK
ncbi:hypothetical protein [Chitinophaga rhizophila]|uniref:Lipoprotein n=1 Tax=Chitinophaga rhizophila TaxID=2866212 RepID=A0ABS7GAQ8_9BACT|nr:hypothetical protein [Chitinophaga rhizophila]MBW8684754.1 hypothetical protein [Chitinophaga rhizophila]